MKNEEDDPIATFAITGCQNPLRPVKRCNQWTVMWANSTGRCNTLDAVAANGVLQMKRRPRIYYSAGQRALMWEHWRKGETLHQIARLFDRYHSSVHRILAESGGIRPVERHRSRSALTLIEREETMTKSAIGRTMVALGVVFRAAQ